MSAPLQHLLEAYAAALDRAEQQYLEARVALAGLAPTVSGEARVEAEAEDVSLRDEDAEQPMNQTRPEPEEEQ